MKVEEVLVYWKCDECNSNHDTEADAKKCARGDRRRAKEQVKFRGYADSVRLQAETIQEIPDLITQYAKKYMKVDVEFKEFPSKFAKVSISHGAPFGKSMGFNQDKLPGIYGRCGATVTGRRKATNLRTLFDRPWHSDYDPGFSFRGFHLGNGCNYGYELYFFLEDFPHLWAKYQRYEELNGKELAYAVQVENASDLAGEKLQEFLNEDEQYQSIQDEIADLENKLHGLKNLEGEIYRREYRRIYKRLAPKRTHDMEEFMQLRVDLGIGMFNS